MPIFDGKKLFFDYYFCNFTLIRESKFKWKKIDSVILFLHNQIMSQKSNL